MGGLRFFSYVFSIFGIFSEFFFEFFDFFLADPYFYLVNILEVEFSDSTCKNYFFLQNIFGAYLGVLRCFFGDFQLLFSFFCNYYRAFCVFLSYFILN